MMVQPHEIIDIVCSARDAAPFIQQTLESVQAQTHRDWRLWFRDDASSDGTAEIVRAAAVHDPRISLLHAGAPNLGVNGGYAWLLDHLPPTTRWVACIDADDLWDPSRLAHTLEVARRATAQIGDARPLLIHSDAQLIDAQNRLIAPSYWTRMGLQPEPTDLARLVIQNVATNSTLLFNRALLERLRPMPALGPSSPDWWIALTAAAFGELIAIHTPLMGYRQHATNDVGATEGPVRGPKDALRRLGRFHAVAPRVRRDLDKLCRQARAFAERHREDLPPEMVHWLERLGGIPEAPWLVRKILIARYRLRQEHGWLRNLGVLWRG